MTVSMNRRHLQDYLSFYYTYMVPTPSFSGLHREMYTEEDSTEEESDQVSQPVTSDEV